jgi:hypothetical protein
MVFFSDFAGWLVWYAARDWPFADPIDCGDHGDRTWVDEAKKIGWYPALLFVGLYFL